MNKRKSIKNKKQIVSQIKKGVFFAIKRISDPTDTSFNGVYVFTSDLYGPPDNLSIDIYSLTHNKTDTFYLDWFTDFPEHYEIIG